MGKFRDERELRDLGENQLFLDIDSSLSQQFGHCISLQPRSVKQDAHNPILLVKLDLLDSVHFTDAVNRAQLVFSRIIQVAKSGFEVGHFVSRRLGSKLLDARFTL